MTLLLYLWLFVYVHSELRTWDQGQIATILSVATIWEYAMYAHVPP